MPKDPELTPEQKIAQQAAEQAIPPMPGPLHIADTIREAKAEDKTPEPEEDSKLLLELSQSDSWKVLKRFITRKKQRLSEMTADSVRKSNFDLNNIGFRYLIFDQVAAALDSVINHVENQAKIKIMERNFEEGEEKDESET